ncbi:MAG: hypothetical protein QM751_07425 [Paludibacteraceae bacterium]
MKKFNIVSAIFLVVSLMAVVNTNAQSSILEWNFYGTSITGKEATSNACLNDVDVKQGVLTRGAGAPGNSGYTNGFVGTIQPSTTIDEAISGDVYFEFKVKPKVGNVVNLSELGAQLRTQTASNYQWRYSRNNAPFADLSAAVSMDNTSTGVDQTPIPLSTISDLQNITSTDSVTFRIYVWGGAAVQGFGFGKSGGSTTGGYKASLIVKGTVVRAVPVIAGWDFESYTGTTSGSLNASSLNENLQSVVLGRGAGLTPGSLNFSYVSTTSLLGATKDAAIANNEYFEITLNAKSTYKTSLTSLSYKYRRNSSGPAGYKWRYSLDGTNFTDLGATAEDVATANGDGDVYSVDLSSISALQNIASGTTATLRMYIWGSGSNTQVFGFGRYYVGSVAIPNVNTIYIKGDVKSINSGTNAIQNSTVSVYAVNNQIIVRNTAGKDMQMKFSICDFVGKSIYSSNLNVQTGDNAIGLPMNLAKGNYIVTLVDENGAKFNSKIIF